MVEPRETTDRPVLAWLLSLALLTLSLTTAAALSLSAKPNAASVAAVFPLWWSAERSLNAVADANANIIRLGGFPSIVIVQPAPDHGTERLSRAGAWFALDPKALAACFSLLISDTKGRPS